MALLEVALPVVDGPLPGDVRAFLREAERRARRLGRAGPGAGFVPCDYEGAYRALEGVADAGLAAGNLFCEWGSGLGAVACLAAMLDFDACGLEIEGRLVEAARRLAADFEAPVEFARASFIPAAAAALAARGRFAWLCPQAGGEDLGLEADDFDVVFAYPWPDEERFIARLFDLCAAPGALLITCDCGGTFRLRRKASG